MTALHYLADRLSEAGYEQSLKPHGYLCNPIMGTGSGNLAIVTCTLGLNINCRY